jgi:hypothetical protein
MNKMFVPLLAVLAVSSLPLAAQQGSLLSQAQRAYLAGDLETAKPLFQKVLADDPQNVAARNYLKSIAQAESQANPGATLEKQLAALILPKVEFREATLGSALDALKKLAAKASNGKIQPNFVLQPGVDPQTPVTLSVTDIPLREVLRYMGQLAKADFVVEKYAIQVVPKKDAAPAL